MATEVLHTTTCARHGHPEFRVRFDPKLVPIENDRRWLIGWLEESVARGERFQPGETCQIGWLVAEVRAGADGALELWEPDFQHLPVQWVEGVSRTVAQLRLQKDVFESVLSSGHAFPSMRQSAIVCTRFARAETLILDRAEPKDHASGWFCGCAEEDHDHNSMNELCRVSLYEAAMMSALRVVPYLALPPGTLLELGTGVPTIFVNGEPVAFKPGSYLDALSRR